MECVTEHTSLCDSRVTASKIWWIGIKISLVQAVVKGSPTEKWI